MRFRFGDLVHTKEEQFGIYLGPSNAIPGRVFVAMSKGYRLEMPEDDLTSASGNFAEILEPLIDALRWYAAPHRPEDYLSDTGDLAKRTLRNLDLPLV